MSFFSNIKKRFKKVFASKAFRNPLMRRTFLGLFFFLAITLIMTIDFLPNAIKLTEGQVARIDIEAPITTTYVDKQKTQELRQQAAEQVQKVKKTDSSVSPAIKTRIKGFFSLVRKYRNQNLWAANNQHIEQGEPFSIEDKIDAIQKEADLELTIEEIELVIQVNLTLLDEIERYLQNLTKSHLDKGIQPTYLENVKTQMVTEIQASEYDEPVKQLMSTIAVQVIQPNLVLDVETTRRLQEEAMAKISPVEKTVQQGEILIRSGNVVTTEDIAMLEALGLQRPRINYRTIIGLIIIVLIVMSGTVYFLYQYYKKIFSDQNTLVLLGLLSILILLIAKILTFSRMSNIGYLVPIAAVSILISILVDSMIAIIFTTVLSILITLIIGGDVALGAVLLVSGVTGIFSVSKVSQRSDLVRAGFIVSGVAAVAIFAYSLTQPLTWFEVFKFTLLGIINGIFAAIMTNGLLPYLENAFGIFSAVKMLELSNPNQPALKKLLMEAPGTYHHSILVGNLVEAAADKVGADSLLARVGAYYHDLGKIKRSYFFSDNQFGGDNPHNNLSPGLSTLIIKSHVKDGVELAKKYKLPKPIVDIIQQHHGTNLISFFYQQALQDEKYENIDEDEFRYEGPKPQTREAALIMLADIVEAAVRAKGFNRSNHNRIEGLVRELIHKKLEEGQLDECDLTLKDLDKIATSFTKVLTGIYHHRVEYPEIAQEMKGAQIANGDSNK